MQIICPKCGTSYGVTLGALGPQGRNVRCAKCREVWLATPHEAILETVTALANEPATPVTAESSPISYQGAEHQDPVGDPPLIESPPIAHDPAAESHVDLERTERLLPRTSWPERGFGRGAMRTRPKFRVSLSAAIAAMAALVAGLIVCRAEIVRVLPQTAAFFKLAGMPVNLRSLKFEAVNVTSDNSGGAPVLAIDGFITSTSIKPVELPRLRLIVRDANGASLYAWNAVLEQAVAQPGERISFKTKLASPPSNAHDLVIRFFTKRDLVSGGV